MLFLSSWHLAARPHSIWRMCWNTSLSILLYHMNLCVSTVIHTITCTHAFIHTCTHSTVKLTILYCVLGLVFPQLFLSSLGAIAWALSTDASRRARGGMLSDVRRTFMEYYMYVIVQFVSVCGMSVYVEMLILPLVWDFWQVEVWTEKKTNAFCSYYSLLSQVRNSAFTALSGLVRCGLVNPDAVAPQFATWAGAPIPRAKTKVRILWDVHIYPIIYIYICKCSVYFA